MLQQVVLQNLFSCNPVAPVAGGVPVKNSNGCITGYTMSASSAGNTTSQSSSQSSSSSTITSGTWNSPKQTTSQWGSTGLTSGSGSLGGFQSSSSSSSQSATATFIESNWESSSEMFVTNSGAYYTDVNNNKHEIILDKEARGFWRDQWGNSHRLEVENDSRSVYFIQTSGDFHSLNVDSFGRLSVTNQMTGRLEDVNIDQHGRAYYTNSQGEEIFLVVKMNHTQTTQSNQGQSSQGSNQMSQGQTSQGQFSQGQTSQGQFSQGQTSQGQTSQGQTSQGQTSQGQTWGQQKTQVKTMSHSQFAGHMFFMDAQGVSHKLFIDSQGGYYMDAQMNIISITEQGTAYYLNKEDHMEKLVISNTGQVGIRVDQTVEILQENKEKEGFYKNQFGKTVMLVTETSATKDFNSMQSRSQFQQQQRSQMQGGSQQTQGGSQQTQGGSQMQQRQNTQTQQSQGSQMQQTQQSQGQNTMMTSNMQDMVMGKMYYVDSNQHTYEMVLDSESRGMYTNASGNFERCSDNGKAYYVDYQHKKEALAISQWGEVRVNLSGNYYQVKQNSEGNGYFFANGSGLFLGSNMMSQYQQSSFEIESSSSSESSSFGGFGTFSSKLASRSNSQKQQKAPASQPADCSPVAYVSGGNPVKNSNGCITSYTVGLMMMI